jgi:hypothetical protein
MVKGLGNNGVVIVEGEGGEEELQMLKGRVAKEKLQTWHLPSNKMSQQTCTLALEVYKKDWQNALVDDTFSNLSNGTRVKELCNGI